jgi:hypothetical protein
MSLARLQELSSLHQAAQPTQVDEAKKSTKDFHGVQDFINDSIADLEDSIGKGGSIAAFADAAVAAKLVKALETFKKTVEGALTDIEVELMSGEAIPAKKLGESLQLNEIKDYSDSGDFTDDLYGVSDHISKMKLATGQPKWTDWMKTPDNSGALVSDIYSVKEHLTKLKQTVRQPRWANWMRVTDDNFGTSSAALNADFVEKLMEANSAFIALEKEIISSGTSVAALNADFVSLLDELDTAFDALENELHTAS